MSLQTERAAIETYFAANWGATAYGLDGHPFDPVAPCVQLFIANGAVTQNSIGRTLNVINNIGLLTVTIYTDGALGSSAWRGYAETIQTLFHNKSIDASGALITTSAQTVLVRFSPPELNDAHPYLGPSLVEPPFRRTNVICPFVRYDLR